MGCFIGADYEDKEIAVYKIKGPKVLAWMDEDSKKEDLGNQNLSRKYDDILRRILARELNANGQVVFLHQFIPDLHEQARKIKNFFPGIRIAIVHKSFNEWPRSWLTVINSKLVTEHLDESCCPDKYKEMREEDFEIILDDFFLR